MQARDINQLIQEAVMKAIEEEFGDQTPKRRFRCSIYFDVWVPETEDVEADRKWALDIAEHYADKIPNSYVGGAGLLDRNSLEPDREI